MVLLYFELYDAYWGIGIRCIIGCYFSSSLYRDQVCYTLSIDLRAIVIVAVSACLRHRQVLFCIPLGKCMAKSKADDLLSSGLCQIQLVRGFMRRSLRSGFEFEPQPVASQLGSRSR